MVYCCVPLCKSNAHKPSNIKLSYHEFPCDPDLCRQWLRRIARKDFVPNDKSPSSKVCSKHFTPEDFVPHIKYRRLIKGAIPTVFPMYPSYALLPPPNDKVKKLPRRKYERKNSKKEVDPAILHNSEISSTNKKSPQHNEDRAFIKAENKEEYNNISLLQTLNHLKRMSTEHSKKQAATRIASNSNLNFANNDYSPKPPGVVHDVLINEAKKDPTASNSLSAIANFSLSIEKNIIENSTEKDGTDVDFDSDMIFANDESPDHPAANSCHPISSLHHPKAASVSVSKTENLTVKYGSGMTFRNKNSPKQPSVAGARTINVGKKDLPATSKRHSSIGINHMKRLTMEKNKIENSPKKDVPSQNKNLFEQKKVNRAHTINDLIQESVAEKNREINNLRSLLLKKDQQLNKMKEEIDKLEDKVSAYESNNHHKILRKIGAENSPQSNFILDQMDNFLKKRPTWRESTIRECTTWVACSPEGYDFAREHQLMVLPCRKTLLKYAYSGELKVDNLSSLQAEFPEPLPLENVAMEY